MKKIYTLFVMAILAILGFSASAASVTATVRVNNPDYASIVPYYSPGGTDITTPLVFENNECEYSFPDGANMRYLKATPITPEHSPKIYLIGYTIYDCDGEVVVENTRPTDKMSYVSVPETADGGIIDLNFGILEDKHLTINVEGTLQKIKVSVDGSNLPLSLGENQVAVPANTSYIIIRPQGVASLYSVTRNGEEVAMQVDGLEGQLSYYYSIGQPADGEVINIITDYPDQECNVTFSCNYDDYIKTVRVNGEVLDGWCPLYVKAGDFVEVMGDAYNYSVVSCSINGNVLEYASYEMSATVTEDTEFKFEVEAIERPGTFVFYTDGGKWDLVNSKRAFATLEEGYTTLGIDADSENPYSLNCSEIPEGVPQEANFYVYINDVKQGDNISYFTLSLNENDVVKAYAATSAPAVYNVAYTLDGVEGLPVIIKDTKTVVDNLDGHTALPGTRISISPAEGQKISAVAVNGENIYESWDGSYTFTVRSDCEVKISYVASEGRLVTVTTNIPDGVIVRYAGEYDFELTSEETVVNLADYDADEWSDFIIVYPKAGYTLESVLYNGEECVGSEEYDWGGSIVVYDLKDGDAFNITVKEMVRDQSVMVYTSGLQNGYCILSEVTGMTSLLDDMSDGYHEVKFATAESPLQFQVLNKDNESDQAYVYLNDAPVSYFYGYELYCEDGDVVKLYLTASAPEKLTVEYNINGGEKTDVVVKHDYLTTIADPASHTVLTGTRVSVAAAEGKSIREVLVNDAEVEPVDGEYVFTVRQNTNVDINFATSGIEGIINEASADQIFNLQGIRITRDAQSLPAGIYIVNGKKVLVK